MERKLNFDKMVYGDFCQRSHHNVGWDEDVENFEKEILEALNEMEEEILFHFKGAKIKM